MEFSTIGATGELRPRVVRIFSNYTINHLQASSMLGLYGALDSKIPVKFIFNKSGKADLVVIINVVQRPRWVRVPKGRIYKILQEPTLRLPLTHRFTYKHEHYLDKIYTHSPQTKDPRQVRSLGYPMPFVGKSLDLEQASKAKTENVSIIASTISHIAGHRVRNAFVEAIVERNASLENHLFGRGRKKPLHDKSVGLEPYRFSVAIENTNIDSYITEKFIDCILMGTVPLYFGAPNVADYFPEDSFIRLPVDDVASAIEVMNSVNEDEYTRRIPALAKAQLMIEQNYNFANFILGEMKGLGQPGRFRPVCLLGMNGLTLVLHNAMVRIASTLPQRIQMFIIAVIRRVRGRGLYDEPSTKNSVHNG